MGRRDGYSFNVTPWLKMNRSASLAPDRIDDRTANSYAYHGRRSRKGKPCRKDLITLPLGKHSWWPSQRCPHAHRPPPAARRRGRKLRRITDQQQTVRKPGWKQQLTWKS